MKTAILEDILRLGKEAGLKSFEQVIVAMFDLLFSHCWIWSGNINIFKCNIFDSGVTVIFMIKCESIKMSKDLKKILVTLGSGTICLQIVYFVQPTVQNGKSWNWHIFDSFAWKISSIINHSCFTFLLFGLDKNAVWGRHLELCTIFGFIKQIMNQENNW